MDLAWLLHLSTLYKEEKAISCQEAETAGYQTHETKAENLTGDLRHTNHDTGP